VPQDNPDLVYWVEDRNDLYVFALGRTFQLTFAKPVGHTAVFKLLTFSADIYY